MTTDFSKHQNIIDAFRGKVAQSDFSAKFALRTQKLPKTEAFLLKMEINRLAAPCYRLIDLRGLVNGECKLYEYEGQNHFLDNIAIDTFEKNVALYKGYTFGVYEAVKNTENNFRVIYQKEQLGNIPEPKKEPLKIIEKTQYPATRYQFNNYHNRIEERMNYAVNMLVTLQNSQEINAVSSDISIHGCKFRLTGQQPIQVNDIVTIKFTGMEEEFQFGKHDVFSYQIKNTIQDADTQLLGCQRIEAPEKDAFERFLKSYIQGNKRRYKINLVNTIEALQARSYEHFLLPKLNELPVFISQESSQSSPRYALTTNNNQAVFQYWQDEALNSTLHCLLNSERLARLQSLPDKTKKLLVFSFIHEHQGKHYFYTMDNQQAAEDNTFFKSFLNFAAKKSTFSVSELSCLSVDKNHIYSPFVLSNILSKKQQYINLPPSDDVKACFDDLSYIVVVKNLTQPSNIEQYQQLSDEKIDTQKLKNYGHKRALHQLPVDQLGVSYKNQRQELRFIYDTEATVECKKVNWQGRSKDFSISGLKIELDDSAMLKKGDIVFLTFPQLQKITSAFDLKQLPYEIVRINKKKTIINLRVHVKEHQHMGRAFFKLLINKNRDKLTTDEYAMLTPGLPGALRTSYAQKMETPALIIQTSGSRYKTDVLISNVNDNKLLLQMKKLSERPHFYNVYPIITQLITHNSIEQNLKTLISEEESVTHIVYLAINHEIGKVEQSVNAVLESEFNSPELKHFFIKKALKRGEFYCLQLKLSRTNEPDMDYLNAELNYISSYAIHRGKQIEQDIWSVVGCIEIFDATDEALLLYELETQH